MSNKEINEHNEEKKIINENNSRIINLSSKEEKHLDYISPSTLIQNQNIDNINNKDNKQDNSINNIDNIDNIDNKINNNSNIDNNNTKKIKRHSKEYEKYFESIDKKDDNLPSFLVEEDLNDNNEKKYNEIFIRKDKGNGRNDKKAEVISNISRIEGSCIDLNIDNNDCKNIIHIDNLAKKGKYLEDTKSIAKSLNSNLSTSQQSENIFNYSIFWSYIPIISTIFPCVGHLSIISSKGNRHNFYSSKFIEVKENYKEKPMKYLSFSYLNNDKKILWDMSIKETDKIYEKSEFSICGRNSYHYIANILNIIKLNNKSNYKGMDVFKMMVKNSKYKDTKSLFLAYSGLIFLFIIIIIVIVTVLLS